MIFIHEMFMNLHTYLHVGGLVTLKQPNQHCVYGVFMEC